MSEFDFLDEAEDSTGAPEAETETPELLEEDVAEDSSEDGAQDEPTDADETEEAEEDEESEFIELDGSEITLDQIRELQKGGMREQDYTKKTQALAEQRKALDSKVSEADGVLQVLSSIEDEIKVMLAADLEDIDLKELRESDYVEYRKTIEQKEEREKQFDDLKKKALEAKQAIAKDEGVALNSMMGWSDSGKREADISMFNDLAKELNLEAKDMATLGSAKVMGAMIELAKLKKASKAEPPKARPKKVKIGKRSSKQPVARKPQTLNDEMNDFLSLGN